MCRIQTDRVLPPELCIQSIDDILYSIGLCHHSVREIPERSLINKPLIITIVFIIQFADESRCEHNRKQSYYSIHC